MKSTEIGFVDSGGRPKRARRPDGRSHQAFRLEGGSRRITLEIEAHLRIPATS